MLQGCEVGNLIFIIGREVSSALPTSSNLGVLCSWSYTALVPHGSLTEKGETCHQNLNTLDLALNLSKLSQVSATLVLSRMTF